MVLLITNIFFLITLTKNPRKRYSLFENPKEAFENLAYEPDIDEIETPQVPRENQPTITQFKTGFENPAFEPDIPDIRKLEIESDDDWVMIDDDKSEEGSKDDPSSSYEKISLEEADEHEKVPYDDTSFTPPLIDFEETTVPFQSEFKDENVPKIEKTIDSPIPQDEEMEIAPEPLLGFYNIDEDENRDETLHHADKPHMIQNEDFIKPESSFNLLKTDDERSTYNLLNDMLTDQRKFSKSHEDESDTSRRKGKCLAPEEFKEDLERLQREYGDNMKLTHEDEKTLFVISRTIDNKLALIYLRNLIKDLRAYKELKRLTQDNAQQILYLEAINKYGNMDVKKGKLYYTLSLLDCDCKSAKFYNDRKNCQRLNYIMTQLTIHSLIKIFDIVERK